MLHFDKPVSSGNSRKTLIPGGVPHSVPQAQNRPNSASAAHQQQLQQNLSKPQSHHTPSTQPATQTQPTSSYPVIRSQKPHSQPTTNPRPAISLKTTESPKGCVTARQMLMSTAIVKVVDRFGNIDLAITLLDS